MKSYSIECVKRVDKVVQERQLAFPDEEFGEVIQFEEDFGDEELSYLASLGLKTSHLFLEETKVTNDGLKHLGGFRDLKCLTLDETSVTDAGLAMLMSLTNLAWLSLSSLDISDAGLAHLSVLTKLEFLGLSSTNITGEGLKSLEGLSNLTELDLACTSITDEGLKSLEGLSNLTKLDLGYNYDLITDESLKSLEGLTNLTELNLVDCVGIGESMSLYGGLQSLRGLTNLTDLCLGGFRIPWRWLTSLRKLTKLSSLDVEIFGDLDVEISDAEKNPRNHDDVIKLLSLPEGAEPRFRSLLPHPRPFKPERSDETFPWERFAEIYGSPEVDEEYQCEVCFETTDGTPVLVFFNGDPFCWWLNVSADPECLKNLQNEFALFSEVIHEDDMDDEIYYSLERIAK